jgi:SAM-dependent methyltransferase
VARMPTEDPAPFSLWREELRRAWRELRGPEASPARVAGAVFLGLFVGALPMYGARTAVLAAASLWFGLDALLVWVVSNVDSPMLVHAVRVAEDRVGSSVAAAGWVGAPAVGLTLGAVGGLLAFGVTAALPRRAPRTPYRLPEGAPSWVQAVERVATRYASPDSSRPTDRVRFHRVRGKLLVDPAAKLVGDLAGDAPLALGSVLDIGAGAGQLGLLLLELGRASSIRGLDWDGAKVKDGVRAAEGRGGAPKLSASFASADARRAPFEPADTVLLVDLLHYFLPDEQDAILDRAAAAVLPGGRIFVREADAGRGVRSWMTWLEERLFTALRYNRGERVRFRPASEIVRRLEGAGLDCETLEAWGRTPFSNVLIVGRRRQN